MSASNPEEDYGRAGLGEAPGETSAADARIGHEITLEPPRKIAGKTGWYFALTNGEQFHGDRFDPSTSNGRKKFLREGLTKKFPAGDWPAELYNRLDNELTKFVSVPPGEAERPEEPVSSEDSRPVVIVTTDEALAVRQVLTILTACDKRLFQRECSLVTVFTPKPGKRGDTKLPIVVPLTPANLRIKICTQARLVEPDPFDPSKPGKPIVVPPWLPANILAALDDWKEVRPIVSVSPVPVLRDDGTIHQTRGWDEHTGVYYEPLGEFPLIPENATRNDAVEALKLLKAGVSEFPWQEPCDRSGWLAEVLTMCCRDSFSGPSIGFYHTANKAGSGKWKLAAGGYRIATGGDLPNAPYPSDAKGGENGEELRKLVVGWAKSDHLAFALDNCPRGHRFGSPELDSILTSVTSDGRELMTSNAEQRHLRTIKIINGNNILPKGDTTRRFVRVALLSPEINPEQRKFRGLDVVEWANQNRQALFGAAITVVSAYIRAGRPLKLEPIGSFEGWSDTIRAALVWCGEPDPYQSYEDMVAEDTESEQLTNLIQLLELAGVPTVNEIGGEHRGKTAADIAQDVTDELMRFAPIGANELTWNLRLAPASNPKLAAYKAVFPGHTRPDGNQLAYFLRGRKNERAPDGRCVVANGENSKGTKLWTILAPGMPTSAGIPGIIPGGASVDSKRNLQDNQGIQGIDRGIKHTQAHTTTHAGTHDARCAHAYTGEAMESSSVSPDVGTGFAEGEV